MQASLPKRLLMIQTFGLKFLVLLRFIYVLFVLSEWNTLSAKFYIFIAQSKKIFIAPHQKKTEFIFLSFFKNMDQF